MTQHQHQHQNQNHAPSPTLLLLLPLLLATTPLVSVDWVPQADPVQLEKGRWRREG